MLLPLIFWSIVLLLVLSVVGYGVFVVLSTLFVRRTTPTPASQPITNVSVVLPCYNEEKNIERKLQNLLHLPDTISREFIILSDGSTDATDEIITRYLPLLRAAGYPCQFVRIPTRQGKPNALNTGIELACGELVILTDSRQQLPPYSLDRLADICTNDASVGAVTCLINHPIKSHIRQFINWIRLAEGRGHGSTVGTYGPLYAIRRALFKPLPLQIILDDLYIPLTIMQQQYRVVATPDVVVTEYNMTDIYNTRRSMRISLGLLQITQYKHLFQTLPTSFKLRLLLHKYTRFAIPFLILALLIVNIALYNTPPYTLFLYIWMGVILTTFGSLLFGKHNILTLLYRLALSYLLALQTFLRTPSPNAKWDKTIPIK